MARRPAAAAAPFRTARPPAYGDMLQAYDRRTRAAYEVMGARWGRFLEAKNAFLAAKPDTPEWYVAAERAYRLGLRSTHAYYLWTCGHTALALDSTGGSPAPVELRLSLHAELQALQRHGSSGPFPGTKS